MAGVLETSKTRAGHAGQGSGGVGSYRTDLGFNPRPSVRGDLREGSRRNSVWGFNPRPCEGDGYQRVRVARTLAVFNADYNPEMG